MKEITNKLIQKFKEHLIVEEKSVSTIQKYIHDVKVFKNWLGNSKVTKMAMLGYKESLMNKYEPSSINAALSSLNSFFSFNEWYECRVKTLKIQKQTFARKEKELSKAEYEKLLSAAGRKKNKRLYFLMQTICSTGIRVSELKFITVEAVCKGQATVNNKGKIRTVILTKQLCKILKNYIKENKIKSGSVFVTKNGNPLDRTNIWSDLKKLCESAGVDKQKVFPHNFRHLFARTFYALQKDIVRLADILGHSNVNTTRIYTMESQEIHRQQLQKLGLLRC